MVSAILYLREHPEEAEALGQRGRAFVQLRFDREQLTTELEKRIAKLLGEEKPVSQSQAVIAEGIAPGQSKTYQDIKL